MRMLQAVGVAALCFAQENPVFKTEVSLVHADAEVTDGRRLLTGFQKDDFRVSDNGKPQPILYFSQNEEPLDVILLFDVSGSMRPKLEKVAAAAHTALAELHPGDRIAVMVFGNTNRVAAPFTEDLSEVERVIQADVLRKRGGGTRILSAIDSAAKYFLSQPRTQRRRAVLIITDNHGMPSGRARSVARNLWEADAVLSGLEVRSERENAALSSPLLWGAPTVALMNLERIDGIAERTGGDVMKGPDPGADFQEMMHRLRLRYSIYYAMPESKPGEERRIRVTLGDAAQKENPEARVRSRLGYRVPKTASNGSNTGSRR